MRTADDFADAPGLAKTDRLSRLAEWRQDLDRITNNEKPANPLFLALKNTVQSHKLDPNLLYALLEAFEFDAKDDVRFKTFEDLRWYTARSADPVGRLVLGLFGYRDAMRQKYSDDICTALQLLNFIQDAQEDLQRGRYYFPEEDAGRVGIAEVSNILGSSSRNKLMLLECDRVMALLHDGAPLVESIRGRLKYELRAVVNGAIAMVNKIRAVGGDVFTTRPKLSKREHRAILLKSLFRKVRV